MTIAGPHQQLLPFPLLNLFYQIKYCSKYEKRLHDGNEWYDLVISWCCSIEIKPRVKMQPWTAVSGWLGLVSIDQYGVAARSRMLVNLEHPRHFFLALWQDFMN